MRPIVSTFMTSSAEPPIRWNAESLRRNAGLAHVTLAARLRSTQQAARDLLARDPPELPAAVIASRQTAGVGRGDHRWHSDAGSLTATILLPAESLRPIHHLPLVAGLAVRGALERWVGADALTVKWPNDVLAGGRKIAGILCERVAGADLVGIGVNVGTDLAACPAEVRTRAVSLADFAPVTRAEVFVAVVRELTRRWADREADWVGELNRRHALTGCAIAVDVDDGTVRGVCRGVDDDGRLLVDDGSTVRRLSGGTVRKDA